MPSLITTSNMRPPSPRRGGAASFEVGHHLATEAAERVEHVGVPRPPRLHQEEHHVDACASYHSVSSMPRRGPPTTTGRRATGSARSRPRLDPLPIRAP